MKTLKLIALGALFAAGAAPASADTIRIEGRNVYGATITKERGVNVIRPLPVVSHVIVNPGFKTPLNVTISENRTYEYHKSVNHNYEHGNAGAAGSPAGSGSYVYGVPGGGIANSNGRLDAGRGPVGPRRHKSHY